MATKLEESNPELYDIFQKYDYLTLKIDNDTYKFSSENLLSVIERKPHKGYNFKYIASSKEKEGEVWISYDDINQCFKTLGADCYYTLNENQLVPYYPSNDFDQN